MNAVARWRYWLGSLIMGRRPRRAMYFFAYPHGTPWWRRQWYRLRPPSAPAAPPVRQPPLQKWMSAPDDELGMTVPMQHLLTSGEDAVVVLTSCIAYTTGFQIGVGIRRKHMPETQAFPGQRDLPEMSLELGIRFSDGRESTTSGWGLQQQVRTYLEAFSKGEEPPEPTGPIIGAAGGGGWQPALGHELLGGAFAARRTADHKLPLARGSRTGWARRGRWLHDSEGRPAQPAAVDRARERSA